MSLYDALSQIAEQVRNQRHLMNNEDATILVSIQPFIHALGYNTSRLMEVRPQYSADAKSSGGEKVDYAIMRDGKPIIFIEAKAANISLSESNWKQLYNYFNAEVGLRFGILTNGIEYRFYTDLKVRNIMDKQPFMMLDMLNLDERLIRELEGFTKAGFDPERILNGAQKERIMRLLYAEMDKPSDEFVKLFARQVHSGQMHDTDIYEYAQLVKDAWRGILEQESLHRIQPLPVRKKDERDTKEIEIPVFGVYKGTRLEATLLFVPSQDWAMMRFDGKVMSASNAILAAKHTVSPGAKLGWHTTWRWWKLRDPLDDSEREIKDLQSDKALVERMRQS